LFVGRIPMPAFQALSPPPDSPSFARGA